MIEFYDNSNSQPKYTGHEQIRKVQTHHDWESHSPMHF